MQMAEGNYANAGRYELAAKAFEHAQGANSYDMIGHAYLLS